MPLWGELDQANNAPKSKDAGGLGVSANDRILYGNTTVSAYVKDAAVGVFLANTKFQGNNNPGDMSKAGHSGWQLRKAWTGPVKSITLVSGGAFYNANSNGYITFGGNTSGSGANAQYFVNANGNVNQVILISGGSDYNVAPTATTPKPNNNNNVIATFSITMGGRAGRVHYETLVAGGGSFQ